MIRTILISSLLSAAAPLAAAQEQVLHAELKAEAQVLGNQVLLGDVAEVFSTDEALARRARSIFLQAPPAPGRVQVLRRDSVRGLLDHAGPVGRELRLAGAPQVVLTPRTLTLSGEDVLTLAVSHLRRSLGSEAAQARIGQALPPDPLVCAQGRYTTEFKVVESDGPAAGRIRLEVHPVVDGLVGPGVSVELSLQRSASVLVAAEDILPGQAVDSSRIRIERRELSGDGGGFLLAGSDLSQLIPRARIRKGDLLRQGDFKKRPIVERGQPVQVVYVAGALRIESEGVTLGEGAQGDRILVRVGKKRRQIYAVVLDSKSVQVGPDKGGQP